ncbi:MAG TPA: Type 1 glutamine amidotransferase-like domain-containing protein [Acidimicrobiales bacterium]|jgi:cyanophycinase|nr:Type 1 glutamine amidotransferase-like domain-containing protein [Acidimicrobiales bacterium]
MTGLLALVGGAEFTAACTFDEELLAASGASEVVVLPTGAAYEHPEELTARAEGWFHGLGSSVRALDVLRRPDALDEANAAAVRDARFVYLAGRSPMHLRSVLMQSPVWDALVEAWHGGAVVAGSVAGGQVLCDPMVDPRGGAFTVGLGLLQGVAVIPERNTWSDDALHRTRVLSTEGLVLLGVDEGTAVIRDADGRWRAAGAGSVTVHIGGVPAGLDDVHV